MTLGERIYALRAAKNLSQGDLAEQLDVSRQSVSKWETDTSVPDLDKLVKLCDLFEVSMDELVRGEEFKAEQPVEQKTKLQQWLENKRVIAALILLALSFVVRIFGPVGIMIGVYGLIPCAILCLVIKRHTVLWCCWGLFALVVLLFVNPFFAPISPFFTEYTSADGAMVRYGLNAWALLPACALAALIAATVILVRKRRKKNETSL